MLNNDKLEVGQVFTSHTCHISIMSIEKHNTLYEIISHFVNEERPGFIDTNINFSTSLSIKTFCYLYGVSLKRVERDIFAELQKFLNS